MTTPLSSSARVDVVIPAYNASRFVVDALRSVVAQAPHVAGIIVVDDGSKDDTVAVVQAFAADYPPGFIRCLSQANAGPSAARNAGLAQARAEFVALLDADDIWQPGKLAAQLERFDHPAFADLGVVYCDYGLMDVDGRPFPNLGFRLDRSIRGSIEKPLLRANLIAGSASAVLIRRTCLDEVGLFDSSLLCSEDWDLWLRLAARYTYDYAPEELVLIRQHPSNAQKNERRMLGGEVLFLNKLHRCGKARWYHYARLMRRLVLGGIEPGSLDRCEQWDPGVRRIFSPMRLRVFAVALYLVQRGRGVARRLLRLLGRRA